VENYVENDTKLWDASTLQRLKELKSIKANVTVGNAFPKLPLLTLDGKGFLLENIHSDYTLLFFYDLGCTHCRKATPALVTMAKQYTNKLNVVAITLDPDEVGWKAFINQFQT
jgi:thiol-disulfide isomerase/thioredoxin